VLEKIHNHHHIELKQIRVMAKIKVISCRSFASDGGSLNPYCFLDIDSATRRRIGAINDKPFKGLTLNKNENTTESITPKQNPVPTDCKYEAFALGKTWN
jgi:hypothetical protein